MGALSWALSNLRRNFSSGRPTVCLVAVFTVRSFCNPAQTVSLRMGGMGVESSTHQSRRETRTRARDEPTVCHLMSTVSRCFTTAASTKWQARSLTGAHDTETSPGSSASDGALHSRHRADVRAGRSAAILGRTVRFFLFFLQPLRRPSGILSQTLAPRVVPRRHGYRQPSATEIVVRRPIALVGFLVSILCLFALPCPAV